ncbi:trehalase-like domain-containing protein [Streptomyces sp. ADI95-16]|uniref:trehalase-like domain-containing protein n=1 Tax=Streptomyces sp. ADI95-16 TaxID=1522758 RepID=UPI0020B3A22A|nr:trehalase-like domain-containing protein [Streptomyces sp. ADI95-16]
MLSDCRSAALVGPDGSVDWLCFPRFDSPAVFAGLLDGEAGHWPVRPVGPAETSRRYLPDTMVLETTFRTSTGTRSSSMRWRSENASADTHWGSPRREPCSGRSPAQVARWTSRWSTPRARSTGWSSLSSRPEPADSSRTEDRRS